MPRAVASWPVLSALARGELSKPPRCAQKAQHGRDADGLDGIVLTVGAHDVEAAHEDAVRQENTRKIVAPLKRVDQPRPLLRVYRVPQPVLVCRAEPWRDP